MTQPRGTVRLVRLAAIRAGSLFDEDWRGGMSADDVTVETLATPRSKVWQWLFVSGSCSLAQLPELNEDGAVLVPAPERQRVEDVIERFARMLAVCTRSACVVHSHSFGNVFFLCDDAEDLAWFGRSPGIAREALEASMSVFAPIALGQLGAHMDDRQDGIALFNEALADQLPMGRFRELLRLLECAVDVRPQSNTFPAVIAAATDKEFKVTPVEVKSWSGLRNGATHYKDKSGRVVRPADVRPLLDRMELVAHDLLLNKARWGARDSARRNLVPITSFVGTDDVGGAMRGTVQVRLTRIMDQYGAFPLSGSVKVEELDAPKWWPPSDAAYFAGDDEECDAGSA